jgi:DNA-binding transcriptional LysR family regulator
VDFYDSVPISGWIGPAVWVGIARCGIHFGAVIQKGLIDLHVTLSGRDKAPRAVPMIVVVPVRQFGDPVLDRNKRKPITLTVAGELVYAEAVAALRYMERVEHVGKLAARGLAGVIRLGYVASGATTGLLARMLTTYRSTHERVRIDVFAMDTPRQLASISNGEIDVGIVRTRRRYPEKVPGKVLHIEGLLVAMSENNPLACQQTLKASDLFGQTFIAPQFNEKEGFAETLESLGSVGGFSIVAEYKVNNFISAVSLAAAGYGITVVPESIKRFSLPSSVFKTICDFTENVHLSLAYRKRTVSPTVLGFIHSF